MSKVQQGLTSATRDAEPVSERQRQILESAAVLFAERGYAATSIRDIGRRVGLLGGSLYHYIGSKEALYVHIHNAALQAAEDRIREAIEGCDEPWRRLEIACETLLELQLDPHSLTMPLMHDLQFARGDLREKLVARRDRFERLFGDLVGDLPLPTSLDRSLYRVFLLSLINNASAWYRGGRLSVKEIARQMIALFRHESGANEG